MKTTNKPSYPKEAICPRCEESFTKKSAGNSYCRICYNAYINDRQKQAIRALRFCLANNIGDCRVIW